MRILELNLKAFGAFSDREPIELSHADPDTPPHTGSGSEGAGLCVVYGANEAGKSTALRAIRGLLYGIPAKTPDDFVHRYPQLRIGARLRFDDGEVLGVMRHKKNKDSLYSYDDREVCRSERLEALVEAVPEALFARFYGLDHPGLRDGSAALLQDDGEVGRALFGAGLGVANLHAVLDGLEQEAAALFAPRASKPRLNASLSQYSEALKAIGQASLDPRVWTAQEERLREASARVEELGRELEEGRREMSRLERLRRALPGLARRRSARVQLEELASVARLPEDFAEQLTTLRADRRSALQTKLRAEARIERETGRRDQLTLAPELLQEQERIESLHQRVGGYQKLLEELPRRESKLAALDEEIESLSFGSRSTLTPERLVEIRHAVAQTSSLRALATEGSKREERLAKAREEAAEAQAELARSKLMSETDSEPEGTFDLPHDLRPEIDSTPLRRALSRGGQLGPIDQRIEDLRHRYEELDFEVGRRAAALGLAAEAIDEIDAAAFPGHEAIDATVERFAALARRREALQEEIRKVGSERRGVDESLARIQSQGVVPRLADLEEQRVERDRTWREIRRSVIDADPSRSPMSSPSAVSSEVTARRVASHSAPLSPSPSPSASASSHEARQLADRFEQESAAADALGDRLRIDAERVAEQAAFSAKARRLDLDLADLLEREKRLEEARLGLEAGWAEAWASTRVAPRAPEEMRGWRRALDEWCGLLGQRREAGLAVERNQTAAQEAMDALREAMSGIPTFEGFEGSRVDEWISQAETLLEALNASAEAGRRAAEKLRQAEERADKSELRREQAEAALSDWRGSWRAAVSVLDLGATEVRPEMALERLDAMTRLLERLRESAELADRVDKMEADVETFEKGVRAVVASCAPTLAEHPFGPATQRMQHMLGEALHQQILFGKSGEALAEAREELEEAITQARVSEQAIAGLMALARVEEESGLDEALLSWREVEASTRVLQQAEAELTNLAEGHSIDALEAATHELDADMLAAEIASLEERVERAASDKEAAIEDLRSQRDALEAMDGTAHIAELAESAESQLAEIRRDVDRYVELRMAKQILEGEIERYRQDNQAPLLRRAGEIFAALTLGAYPRVESDFDPSGAEIRLVAVDPANRRVPVAGLSAGTRDQLFLAIRLASFEEATARGESMPLIADDILIEFDDERSRATLEVLADMGRKNQILLFSHHRHIADIARDFGDRSRLVEL